MGGCTCPQVAQRIMSIEQAPISSQPASLPSPPLYNNFFRSAAEQEDSIPFRESSRLARVVAKACLPITLCASWFVVDTRTEAIVLECGRLVAEHKNPGWTFQSIWGRTLYWVPTSQISCDLPTIKVADHNGSPIVVSAVVTYSVVDAKKAVLKIDNYAQYVRLQAAIVLREVASMYPYDSEEDTPSLRNNIANISDQLADKLDELVAIAGCKISSFRIDELSYAPEISAVMLRKQAATALIAARNLVVKSAVDIACDSIMQLELGGMHFSDEAKADLAISMVTTMCSDNAVHVTLPLHLNS